MQRFRLPVVFALVAALLAPLFLASCEPTAAGSPGGGVSSQPWNRQLEGFEDARYGNFPQSR